MERTLIYSDIHFASSSEEIVDLAVFKFGKWYKPHHIFLNGDVVDNNAVSRYVKPPGSAELGDDLAATRKFLQKLRRTFKDAEIHYISGNHEKRLDDYLLRQAPEIYGYISLPELLELDSLDIEYVDSGHIICCENV